MMKRISTMLLICSCTMAYAGDIKWQDFENNAYLGLAYSTNKQSVQTIGDSSSGSIAPDFGATALFDNHVWANFQMNANFLNNNKFVGNWLYGATKIGYSLQQTRDFNFIPYAILGYGNNGAYYTNTNTLSYGVGMLSEYGITSNYLAYIDVNYQWQNFGSGISQDFSTTALGGLSQYNLTGTPYTYGIELGGKWITQSGLYINPFIKYNGYQQQFSAGTGVVSYGTLTPEVSQFQLGINVGLTI